MKSPTPVHPITLDPTGELYGIPTWPWRCAPPEYATYRQLAKKGLRPGGQPVAAQVLRRRRGKRNNRLGPLTAFLYRVDLAKPKRPVTDAMRAASAKAIAAKRICSQCGIDRGYIPPLHTGKRCFDCAELPTAPVPAPAAVSAAVPALAEAA